MRIPCPHCGTRDLREFEYVGSAKLMARPTEADGFHDYIYLRDNPSGENAELWQHVYGCRAYLHVVRNVTTHEVISATLARDVKGGTA